MKKCAKCHKSKNNSCFHKNKTKIDGLATECRECCKAYMKKYYAKNKNKLLKQNKENGKQKHAEAKRLCIEHYSNGTNKCCCCGESNPEFLSLNHINGGGRKDRQTFKGARTFCGYLVKNNFPKGINIMCFNCNLSYGFFGYCPHKTQSGR